MTYINGLTGNNVYNMSVQKTPQEAMGIVNYWFQMDKEAKFSYFQEMEEMYLLYKGDHWDVTGPDGNPLRDEKQKMAHPNAVENMTFSLVEGLVAEFSQDVDITDFPVEKNDQAAADVMSDLKKFLGYKNRIISEREKWLRNFFLYGTGIWHTYFDPNWRGGKGPNRWEGDIRWVSLHPNLFYPDARCKDSIEDGMRCHKAIYKTIEYVRQQFPDHADELQQDTISADMILGDEDTDTAFETEEGQVLLVETWYKGDPLILDEGEENKGPGLHIIWWAGEGQRLYLKHSNYVYFEPDEDVKYPFVLKSCYPREKSVWGFGEAYMLKNPQLMRNKTAEMIIEGHLHHALGQTYYDQNAMTPEQKKKIELYGTMAGMWFGVNDINGIRREFGQGVPASLENETERLGKVMESTVGRFDITQGKSPGSVTAFRALDLLSNRAQVRLRSKEMAITSSYEEVGNYINTLISLFYTEDRAYRILNKDDQQDRFRYGMFKPSEFNRVFLFGNGETMPMQEFQSLRPAEGEQPDPSNPFHMMQPGQDFEIYSPQFDVVCKVTTTLPTDRVFYMDMAKELYADKLIDGETFFYVMEHGKFPPFEEMMQKEQQKAAMMQAMMAQQQALAAGGQPIGGQIPQGPPGTPAQPPGPAPAAPQTPAQPPKGINDALDAIESILQSRPELVQQLEGLPVDQRKQIINQLMQDIQNGSLDNPVQ